MSKNKIFGCTKYHIDKEKIEEKPKSKREIKGPPNKTQFKSYE